MAQTFPTFLIRSLTILLTSSLQPPSIRFGSPFTPSHEYLLFLSSLPFHCSFHFGFLSDSRSTKQKQQNKKVTCSSTPLRPTDNSFMNFIFPVQFLHYSFSQTEIRFTSTFIYLRYGCTAHPITVLFLHPTEISFKNFIYPVQFLQSSFCLSELRFTSTFSYLRYGCTTHHISVLTQPYDPTYKTNLSAQPTCTSTILHPTENSFTNFIFPVRFLHYSFSQSEMRFT